MRPKHARHFPWLLYLAPALLVYTVFMAFPLIDSLRLSLFSGNSQATRIFVGLDNFKRLFTDPEISTRYWGAFFNTWKFFFVHLIVQNGLGIFFAVLLTHETMKGRHIYQTIIFIPTT
ncbi:MAG: sugar ABC transporter permease, partial [Sphaerochaeta sp.]|nr:sugar ABC transporter permease [Sphaerochaeta sp.]